MGIEKDYLMRQLMMLFEVLQRILRRRKDGNSEEALEEIQYFYDCLKIETDISALSIEEMIHLLEAEKKLSLEQIELVGFVMKEQAELAADEVQQMDLYRKSWFLLEKVDREGLIFSMDRQMKLAELRSVLNSDKSSKG
jgi:predicted glycosyltransferase